MKSSSKTRCAVTVALTLACAFAALGTASATPVSTCQYQIESIQNDLQDVVIYDKHQQVDPGRTIRRLERKLESARSKLDARKGAKYGDAIQDLWDFIDKLEALASDGKMKDPLDATRLICATHSKLPACTPTTPPPPGAIQCICIVALGSEECADSVTP